MKTPSLLLTTVALSVFSAALHAATFQIGAHRFAVPDDFEIQLAAGTNLAPRPVSAGFDDKGRLYVTDSSGSNDKPFEQLKNPTHRVLRLEDTDGDGIYDKSTVFADKVMFPQGCLWHDGSVYVAGPPSIWKFTDTDGDGVADKREEWFKGGTLTGCANDIHGPYLGPDGYLYWTKGAFDEQTHTLGNGRVLKDRAAHIYRARPDGSDLDVIMSGGMDNPVGVAFTAEGEAVFTSTFIDFSQPGYRDGIGHAVYGGVFGKVNSALDDGRVKRTGPELMHPFVQFGAGAPSGLCRYESSAFGADYRDNLFASLFNLHKITRHILRPNGATYASTDSDFVVSDNIDFHPTDVLPAPDGSLLVVDTGAWYKLCCPSSQIAKRDVLGGIYRVKRTGPRSESRPALISSFHSKSAGPDEQVVAIKQIALRRDAAKADELRQRLDGYGLVSHVNAPQARACAEALGRIGDRAAVPALLTLAERARGDEILSHAAIFALIEIGDEKQTRLGLKGKNSQRQRAALIALEQIGSGSLKAEDVTPHLASKDPSLRQAASWIVGRHPEWSSSLAGFFRERLAIKKLKPAEREELQQHLAQFSRSAAIQELVTETLRSGGREAWLVALSAMAQAGLKEPPPLWLTELARLIRGVAAEDAVMLRQAVTTARALSSPKVRDMELLSALLNVAQNSKTAAELRLEAFAAVSGSLSAVPPELFGFVRSSLDPAGPLNTRSAAATGLSKATLAPEQLLALTESLKSAGPLEMPKLLSAFEKSHDEALGLTLVSALKQVKSSSLRLDLVKSTLTNYPASVQAQGEELLNTLNADAGKQKAHLEMLLADIHGKGDVRRGQAVFNSQKAACFACHAIGYQGGKVGPDLTRISEVRSERDLLEAIIYPSASFVRSYEPMIVATKSGEDHSGVLRHDAPDEVLLATGPTTEVRIPRSEISEMRPGAVSVMPQGLDEQLSRQELADLIAFLRNTKWGAQ